MEVAILSRGYVSPSSPTPQHLKTHKLSLLDQYSPNLYPPILLYYRPPNQDTTATPTSSPKLLLKQSLSQTLTRFYPLAGKLTHDLNVDCNDDGAYYIEAKANYPLAQLFNKPDLQLIRQFSLLDEMAAGAFPGSSLVMIQVTEFSCGGFVISLSITHVIADAFTELGFLKCWAALTRNPAGGPELAVSPIFESPSIFPQNESQLIEKSPQELFTPFFKYGKCGTRRFVFDAHAIAALKDRAKSSNVPYPSRVEAVSALIWERAMACFNEKHNGMERSSLVTHTVNLRSRMEPRLPDNAMGNLYLQVPSLSCAGKERQLKGLVSQVREAIKKVNSDFLKSLQGYGGYLKLCEVLKEVATEIMNMGTPGDRIDYISFSSLCKFGIYDIDFGWGKPEWIHGAISRGSDCPYVNFVLLFDTKSGDGIEAWINLEADVLDILENDTQILQHASLDPSPLQLA